MTDWLNKMRTWAQRAGPKPGPLPNGPLHQVLGVEKVIMFAVDSRGRLFQLEGAFGIMNATYRQIYAARTEMMTLLDHFDVQEMPPPPPLDGDE